MDEEKERLQIVIPTRWMPKLEAIKDTYGALTVQDVIRSIIASVLFPEECEVEKIKA